jgi:outer membrane protein assembly factor BamB
MFMRWAVTHWLSWLAAAILIAGAPLLADDHIVIERPGAAAPLNSLEGKDNTAGVYVRDSAIALEEFALAQRMERLREWGKSADVYQEILEKYPDRVVPAPGGVDADNRIIQYTSVTEAVRQALCRWPQQGLDVYRAHYQTAAAKLLASAKPGDMSRLHEVFSLYFVTDTAKTAGITMMDNYFEQGDYAAVAQIGHRLLDWHPNLLAERPMVLYRTALAEKLCGDITAARAHLAELRQNFAAAVGTIRGTDVELADSLEQELSSASGVVRAAASDSWLTVGGDPSRAKVSSSTVKPGARLYSIPLTPVTWAQVGEPSQRHNLEQQDKSLRDLGAGLGVMPAVDHGELFFQDNVCIYAVSLDSGVPLSGWANTYPNGVYRLPVSAAPLPTGQQLCVTLTDQYVTAVMGLPDHLALSNGVAGGEARLVCLDRHSGAELWNTTVRHAAPDSQSNLRDLRIGGAPLVVGDNLYILGRGGKGPQFEDCYVLCFRVATGQFCWASYIASANSDQAVLNPEIPVGFADAISHIAYASGRLYVLSNLGAAAALDAYTGTVIWLDIYRDQPVATANAIGGPFMVGMQSPGNVPPPSPPWIYNPVMVQNGRVFILPNDNDSLFIYDADTGKQIKRIWLSDFADSDNNQQASKPDTLLCVNGDVLYLGSPSGVCRLPWEKYDHTNNPKPSGYWVSTEFYTDETSSPQQVRGRSFVTADAVYVPTIPALRRVLLKSGMIDPKNERFPRGNWDQTQEGPGNVLATADHVIIAGDRHVAVYTDIDLARLKLDREVAAAPADPEPRLNYAEVMFVGGQAALAEDKLNEAFELLGGQQNLRPGPLRDRGFADAMNFAVHLSSKANTSEEARAQRLFDLAQAAAQSPSQQVAYRLARARFELLADRAAAAVELYQQILFDSAMRVVSVPDPDTSVASQAGIVAEKAIGQIVRTPNGRAAYDKFEQAAAAKLAEAQASNDPAKLLEVAKIYPNAQVARPAMMAAADVFEAQGNPRLATLVLQQLLNKSPDQDRAAVLEAMARNYLKMPRRLDVAVSRLALAAAAAPAGTRLHRPLPLPDGTVLADIPLTQARDLLSNFAARISTDTLPDLCLPTSEQRQVYQQVRGKLPNPFLSESPDTLITGVDALIVPMEGFARNDRIVTWDARSGLSIYPIGTPLPICRCSTVTDAVRGAAWMEGALLAWTSSSAFLIDGQKGAVLWQVNLSDMPAIEVISDSTAAASSDTAAPDNPATPNQAAQMGEQIVQVAPIGDRVVFGTSTGRIFAVASGAGGNGHVVWQTRVAGHAADALLANDDFTVVRFHDDQNVQLIVLRSFSGELAGRKSFGAESGAYPINMALGADGTLVYTMPDHLCIQDLYEANLTEQGMEPKFSTPVSPQTPPIFFTLGQPNQLIVHGGRAFAVSNQGNLVRVYSLDTGKPWSYHSTDATGGVPGQLSTESSGSSNVTLHISGNFLYVLSPQKLVVYRVDFPDVNWRTFSSMSEPHNFEQVLFGRDYLVILDRCPPPLTVSNKRSDHVRLQCCNRAAFKSMYGPQGESGRLVYEPEITGLHGPDAWQAVEGGIVYFNAGTVHTLLGARRNMPTTAPAN